jgi:hypothetical protein
LFYFDEKDTSISIAKTGLSLQAHGVWHIKGAEFLDSLQFIYGTSTGTVTGSVRICVDVNCVGSVSGLSAWGATFFATTGGISGFPLTVGKVQ